MDTVISNIGQLVTPTEHARAGQRMSYDIRVTRDTELHIQDGSVSSAEPGGASSKRQTIDARGGVVMPGLVDPYWTMPTLPGWIQDVAESRLPNRDLVGWTQRILHRAVRSGVTAVEVKCPHDPELDGLSALAHLKRQLRPRVVGTLLASLPGAKEDRDRSVSLLISGVIPEIRRRRLVTFFDIGWEDHSDLAIEGRTVLRAAGGAGLRPKLHIQSIAHASDVEELAHLLDVTAVEGASHLPIDTVERLAENGIVPVYLPGLLDGGPAASIDVRSLIDRGFPVAIGSGSGRVDSRSSSMWSVLAAAMERMELSLPEAIVSCTMNNAWAMDMAHEIGSLEVGKSADLIVLDLIDYREITPALGLPPVSMVMINGEVVHSA
jgi:imidazolonepropionase